MALSLTDAAELINEQQTNLLDFVGEFHDPKVMDVVEPLMGSLFGYDARRSARLRQLFDETIASIEAQRENERILRDVLSLNTLTIRKLTQLALEMKGMIPPEKIPTPTVLRALEILEEFDVPMARLRIALRGDKIP